MEREIVLIHGAFAGPWCMKDYAAFFRGQGWTVHVPALRFHGGDPSAEPDPAFANTSVMDYTNDIAAFVATLGIKPVLLGHAIAGVVAQQVASRGLASAIVLINPNAPWGTLPATDDERAVPRTFMELGPFWKKPMRVPFDLMASAALNKLDEVDQHKVFDQLGAESGRVMFEMFFWMFDDHAALKVDFDAVTCPVLGGLGNRRPCREPGDMQGPGQALWCAWHIPVREGSCTLPVSRARMGESSRRD